MQSADADAVLHAHADAVQVGSARSVGSGGAFLFRAFRWRRVESSESSSPAGLRGNKRQIRRESICISTFRSTCTGTGTVDICMVERPKRFT